MKKTVLSISILLSLSSCAYYHWVSDTKPSGLLDRDLTSCETWAYQEFPPKMYNETKTEYQTIRHRDSRGYESETVVPNNVVYTEDANIQPRETALKKCMMDNGWRLEAVKN
jgi:hypothetical protein